VRCATEPKKGTFFAFDFSHLKMFLIPTAYTLRHYDSWDTEALRNWKLEVSGSSVIASSAVSRLMSVERIVLMPSA